MGKVTVCVITGYGINADIELLDAFRLCGASPDLVHVNDLITAPQRLMGYGIIGFPGGFSFGDHLGSGLVFANLFKRNLKDRLEEYIRDGGLLIGICNGFQVLVKMGVLPNLDGRWTPCTSLIHNKSGVFTDRWVTVEANKECRCVWTAGIGTLDLPVRHGEGRFITASAEIHDRLEKEQLIALTYHGTNPNGSEGDVAGITDPTGRIFGLMPHPEAYPTKENHPVWKDGDGLQIFRNGIAAAERK
ncbi:MAG: phosphoribosylformylglycinamidine synthase subunit PurQ [Spirochaetales bacterium]|nr:phosphoribosylformylglycinamidine synthase subunit PurQ [Spirochaetales bacterium]